MVSSTTVKRPSSTPRKSTAAAASSKSNSKPNASILSFFKKTEKGEDSLFVGATSAIPRPKEEDLYAADNAIRFNEVDSPVKRRKTDIGDEELVKSNLHESNEPGPGVSDRVSQDPPILPDTAIKPEPPRAKRPKRTGPFIDNDSDDDDDEAENSQHSHKLVSSDDVQLKPPKQESPTTQPEPPTLVTTVSAPSCKPIFNKEPDDGSSLVPSIPALKHEDSSYPQLSDFGDYGEGALDDLDVDTFEGEETREMRFMREQARLEAEDAGLIDDYHFEAMDEESLVQSCPICDGNLHGLSADDVTKHVNACLDGNPLPLPTMHPETTPIDPAKPEVDLEEVSKRFARSAVPRPAQANPFVDIAESAKITKTSAFSKLMSSNVEDTAWATAAAAENAARGRPAYERTCPFYKIMPGFSICVDAFRYGAVKDCNAYFLSHFHSDHYIGLTSNWRHGPIYCSKVTGSLVKNQLRTAAKWVVELEFDETQEVPGTGGAKVTMIPANHCPGSSLFLFEKTMGNGVSRRILHCGDFRACPAHISHPLLQPNIVDAVSGKLKQQKIDQCYLDTTYLNPRYSFPPQDDVIKATADLCASLSSDPDSKDDVWESAGKEAGTQNVSKYFQKAPTSGSDSSESSRKGPRKRLLVVCGTYSIGKERICIAIAKALGSKIFASPGKIKICKQLYDPELTALLTTNPREAQVHMQMLMEIRAETLQEYLNSYKPHFSRIVGFRPSGWTFRPANGKPVPANTSPGSIPTEQILHGKGWRTNFGYKDFIAQRGSTKEAMCFGVPYSEHSSFRELALFVMSLRIEKVIPTVNVGSEQSRNRMKAWIDRWQAERRRAGLVVPLIEGTDSEKDGKELWNGKSGNSGGVWW